MSVRPETAWEALMISFIPVRRTALSTGSVNHGLVRMPIVPAEEVRPTRPREVIPVDLGKSMSVIRVSERGGREEEIPTDKA
jgi:hypothetical protein